MTLESKEVIAVVFKGLPYGREPLVSVDRLHFDVLVYVILQVCVRVLRDHLRVEGLISRQ